MVKLRPLKTHEQKLVKKVDFYNWKNENPEAERAVLRTIAKYGLRDRAEYGRYSRISRQINETVEELRQLPAETQPEHYRVFQRDQLDRLAVKLHEMGVLDSPAELDTMRRIPVGRFCRRRLSFVLKMKDMAPTIQQAELFVLHGHVRVGPEVINDPAFLVTRTLEDFLTWSNTSNIKRTIAKYRGEEDDYELLGA